MILLRIVKDFACPACKGTLLQEGAVYSCTGCGYRATCVEPFPLEAGKTPVLTSIRTTRSVCLTCRRSLTDPVGCAECGVYKITTEAVHAPENPELARRATEQLPRPDGTWIVRVAVRDREHKIQGDPNATQAERYKAAAWLASVYGGDWQGWYQRAWGETG